MYVKRPLKFVYKQYHWFTHKNSIGKPVTETNFNKSTHT